MHMNVVTAETLIGRTLTLVRYFTVVIDNHKPKIEDQLAGLAVMVGTKFGVTPVSQQRAGCATTRES